MKKFLSYETGQNYRALRANALRLLRAFDLSEASFQRLFTEGLQPLDAFIREALQVWVPEDRNFLEAQFDRATREILRPHRAATAKQYVTVDSLLDLLMRQERILREDVFVLLQKGGAVIQEVLGSFVQTDDGELNKGTAGGKYEVRFAPKTKELVLAMTSWGVFADDLVIYRGGLRRGMMRQKPYTIIEIPRLKKQVAICDQIGEVAFVSTEILPIHIWANSTKDELKAMLEITDVRYSRTGGWLDTIHGLLFKDGETDMKRYPKLKQTYPSRKPLLTEEQIVCWIKLFHEKTAEEGNPKWPSTLDKIVWDRDEAGNWGEVSGENWHKIGQALTQGSRGLPGGSSLAQLKDQYGLNDNLTEEQIVCWIKLFHEKTAEEGNPRWPSTLDKIVWDKDEAGNWIEVSGESWHKIDLALLKGLRGLPGGSSLAQLKDQYGLNDNFTEEQIVRWIKLFHEKTAEEGNPRWPSTLDKIVWDRDEAGNWIEVSGESWHKIGKALTQGSRGLPGGSSLAQLKDQYGLNDNLTEEQIVCWIKLFHEKTAEEGNPKWPSVKDKIVWDKDEAGNWIEVSGESWSKIGQALTQGSRGLPGGSSLAQLKDQYGLVDDRILTEAQIVRWIKLFHEKTAEEGNPKWPSTLDKIVWDKDEAGNWGEVSGESWSKIHSALIKGSRGLPGGSSLAQLRKKHGLVGAPGSRRRPTQTAAIAARRPQAG